jgi:heme A synthase
MHIQKQIRKIRILIVLFIIGLVLSGVTAFPIETQLEIALAHQNLLPDFVRS